MVSTTSIAHELKNAIADTLALRPALQGVQIATAFLGAKTGKFETIQLNDVEADQEWGALGNRSSDEVVRFEGAVAALWPGGGEDTVRKVRERAQELFAEVEVALKADPKLGVTKPGLRMHVIRWHLSEGATPEGRFAGFDFVIEAKYQLRQS